MYDTCKEEICLEKCADVHVGSLMMDSVKMLFDLCGCLNSIEQIVFGRNDNIPEKPDVPESLHNRARMNCDLALACIEKANHIHDGLM